MDYTLHQLRIFHKIAQVQSVTKAAEELFLTQPAISIQLKKFQEQFSVPLFEIVGRQLYITDFGKEIAETAEKILNEVQAINYKTLTYKNQLAGRLKVSVVSTGKYVMPYFLSEFMNHNRGVDLVMDVTNKTRVIESLERNEVDFSLVSVVPDQLKAERVPLLKNKLYLVGSPQLKVEAKDKKMGFLKKYPLIYREEGSATRNAMEEFIQSRSISTYKKLELTSNEAVKQAVIAGLGYSIMPLIGLKNELKSHQLEIIPLKGLPIITQWNLIWMKSKNLSPVAKAYLEHIEQNKDQLIGQHFDWYEKY
ncbi:MULTISPECIES: LysR family transcriptional regulator [Roseivirga]|jgi:DNA-binding transcriptional LysR family regulator|uniref:LysR family transcriptional regulator n=1 Tax=Roseivirga spongicola TaxID=333140 RepID=A0A150XAK4_9BACT|nr:MULTISPECIES: LysR family transcriptional regulator [Roseivirga]PWL29233.1 MAG: LysR family transcriptional regulator [Roseivirga sp. XM-24bin3]KYG75767.1 LysR family transcriptional regulator [Roseivirga spongicola]MBO6495964.1 LysR family transcriptional regulator [Roseivirga sp.]MBO6662534.1 LysR family transcriptional regulator [Roseivirga sp.]MBO6761710.1 LysR family transcriptional regulator [Roseivirga sp.]